MEPTNLTIEILKDIRAEIRLTREVLSERIDGVSGRIGGVSGRVDGVSGCIESLAERQLHMETRLATELIAVASAVGLVTDELRGMRAEHRRDRELRTQVAEHERRIGELEKKTG